MTRGEPCMCGATDCPICGPLQGYSLAEPPSAHEIRECADEIICDRDLLAKSLNDEFLAEYLADAMQVTDKACAGDLAALQSLTRAMSNLQKCLRNVVEDEATEMAQVRMEA